VLEHLAALIGAVPARFGARGHVLVVRELLARRSAFIAAFRAAFQHVADEGTLASAEGGARLATFGTVGAKLRRLCVFLLAIGYQRQTVREA